MGVAAVRGRSGIRSGRVANRSGAYLGNRGWSEVLQEGGKVPFLGSIRATSIKVPGRDEW